MKRHHNGSGRAAVIHPDWAAHHAPVAEGTMPGTISLRDPDDVGEPVWNPVTEQTEATPAAPYYDGSCRVQALTGEARVITQADDPETLADYLITVPRDVHAVREGHLAKVTDTDDPAVDGRTLRVDRVVRGTHRFERDLFCTLTD